MTGVAVVLAGASATPQAAAASVAGGPAAVTHQVSGAAQSRALDFWTPARMAGARPLLTAGKIRPALGEGTGPATAPAAPKPPKGTPTATKFNGVPTVGALFFTTGGHAHFCTASVIDSTAGDLVLTAAHCVYNKSFATNIEYVPQYHDGHRPYGAWAVSSITVATGWQHSHNPNLDFAFLVVGAPNGPKIQARTGGLTIGFNRAYDEKIEVIGYNDTDDAPVHCATKSFEFRPEQMEFYCHGFWTGTSGGPWINGYNARTGTGTVFGVIGGYEGGGDYDWASYSSYFGSAASSLYKQAEQPAPKPSPSPSPSPSTTATSSSPTPTRAPTPTETVTATP